MTHLMLKDRIIQHMQNGGVIGCGRVGWFKSQNDISFLSHVVG
jgi:hypothetical protein